MYHKMHGLAKSRVRKPFASHNYRAHLRKSCGTSTAMISGDAVAS